MGGRNILGWAMLESSGEHRTDERSGRGCVDFLKGILLVPEYPELSTFLKVVVELEQKSMGRAGGSFSMCRLVGV